MKMFARHNKRQIILTLIVLIIACTMISFWVFNSFKNHMNIKPLKEKVRRFLTQKVVKIEPVKVSPGNESNRTPFIIYVLAGAKRRLIYRLKKASEIYEAGIGKKIYLMREKNHTRYNKGSMKILTKEKWLIKTLEKYGVSKNDIEFIKLEEGYFGTYSEVKGIYTVIIKKGCKKIIVITSLHHTMRTWLTFSKIFKNSGVRLNIYGSEDRIRLPDLATEYFKLIFYEYILLLKINR